ncbi:DUF3558 domain-containing protein [Amycolatopsis sp. CA-161197]|uniref:DUF3558 domain-containing protein n=1 Tax=Amycolatopsis sp. CA-161197 TaxID=3239922 RepID=UPI003D8F9C48
MTNHRQLITMSGAAVVLAFAAGCSGSLAAVPATTNPSPTAPALPHSGAPKVQNPLPASVLAGDPCQQALTADQLEKILGTAPQGKRDDASIGPACNWTNADTAAVVGVGYTSQTHQGLSALYQNTKPQATVWKELAPIQGFPAVAHSTYESGTNTGFCQVSVGIADDLSFDASLGLSTAKIGKVDPCGVAEQVADMVVTNLRQKAGA